MTTRKKKKKPQTPVADRMLQTWQQMSDLDKEIMHRIEAGLPEKPELADRHISAHMRFDELVLKAHEEGYLKRTISSVYHRIQLPRHAALMPQLSQINEAIGDAYGNATWDAQDQQGNPLSTRAALFGVPLSGSLASTIELANSHFVRLVKKNGWMPQDVSNVVCLGALNVSDAWNLVQDPSYVWNLSQKVLSHQAGRECFDLPVPGLMRNLEPGPAHRVGGYVLLMGVFGIVDSDVEFTALDLPDNPEQMEEQWLTSCHEFFESMGEDWDFPADVGVPCSLAQATREALVMQLELSMDLIRRTEHPNDESDWLEAAFEINTHQRTADLVGLFSDGTETRLPNALPDELVFEIQDLASRFILEEPAFFYMKGDAPNWSNPPKTPSPRPARSMRPH